MSTNDLRFFHLIEELETSKNLIKAGFGSLQEIDMENDFYHLPHLLLASGFERLMKCYIALVYEGRDGDFPDMAYMKELGHDLVRLCDRICRQFYGGLTCAVVKHEFDFVSTDSTVRESLRILSLFGKFGRYYNLDIVAGCSNDPIDPKREWESLEARIEDMSPYSDSLELLHCDYYPRVHAKLIAGLERFVRAIALQFTIGDHADSGRRLQRASVVYSDFRNLRDEELGVTDYRPSVRILQQKKYTWEKHTEQEVLDGKWPTRIVNRAEFGNDWPFRIDRVVVEQRDKIFLVVYIEGYAFALCGAASSHLQLPSPHEAGVAILGKSIRPFSRLAESLRNE